MCAMKKMIIFMIVVFLLMGCQKPKPTVEAQKNLADAQLLIKEKTVIIGAEASAIKSSTKEPPTKVHAENIITANTDLATGASKAITSAEKNTAASAEKIVDLEKQLSGKDKNLLNWIIALGLLAAGIGVSIAIWVKLSTGLMIATAGAAITVCAAAFKLFLVWLPWILLILLLAGVGWLIYYFYTHKTAVSELIALIDKMKSVLTVEQITNFFGTRGQAGNGGEASVIESPSTQTIVKKILDK